MDPTRPVTSSAFSDNFDADLLLNSAQLSPRSDDLEFDSLDDYEGHLMSSQPELASGLIEIDEEETQKITTAERPLKGKKHRERGLAEVVRKGNEKRKAEAAAEGIEIVDRGIFDKKRENKEEQGRVDANGNDGRPDESSEGVPQSPKADYACSTWG